MNDPTTSQNDNHELGSTPMYSFSRRAIQAVDRAAVTEFYIPGIVLMENAARSAAQEIMCFEAERIDANLPRPVLILCGKGNNGGDGLALARHLHNEGFKLEILLAFDPDDESCTDEVKTHLKIVRTMHLPTSRIDEKNLIDSLDASADTLQIGPGEIIIVDSLLGTGLTSPPRPPFDELIQWINDRGEHPHTTIVAIDLPSGLDCDSGKPLGDDAVRAHLTVTFVGLKKGFLEPEAAEYVGDLAIGDIGAPEELAHRLGHVVTADEVFE